MSIDFVKSNDNARKWKNCNLSLLFIAIAIFIYHLGVMH